MPICSVQGPIPRLDPPPAFRERRRTLRRAADRLLHEEATFLARSMDIAASREPAQRRLAQLLELIGRTAGAARTALVVDGDERRVLVAMPEGTSSHEAEGLAAWLDAHAPRPRSHRAAAAAAPVTIVTTQARGPRRPPAVRRPRYALQPLPDGGRTALGFAFRSTRAAQRLPARFPPAIARHAAAVLALATRQVDEEHDLHELRGQDAERRRFVSTVTHELRTPLGALTGYLDLLLEDPDGDPEARAEFLHRSRDLVDGLGHLVGDLLELSRLESGQLRLSPGPFSGAEVGQAALDAVMPLARARGLALEARLPSRLRTIYADRRRVEQILINLLSNAIKFSRTPSTVALELRFQGAVACYVVRDGGDGIGPEERVRVFEPFYRGAAEGRIVGTGLGLPIARELAQRMGGGLDVASSEGQGSAFAVALPATAAADQDLVTAVLARILLEEERLLAEVSPRDSAPAPGHASGRRAERSLGSGRGERAVVHGALAIAD